MKGLEVDGQYPENLDNLHNSFWPKDWKLKTSKSLELIYMIKLNML